MSYEKKTLLYSVRRALSLHALLTIYRGFIWHWTPKHALLSSADNQSMLPGAFEELPDMHVMLLYVSTSHIHVFKVGEQLPLERPPPPPIHQAKGHVEELECP